MPEDLKHIFAEHARGEKFRVREIEVSSRETNAWVQLTSNPVRFVPEIFTGDWANTTKHPRPGQYRLLAIVDCDVGLSSDVIREGKALFVTPFV